MITVFTPTYNRAKLLPRLYESLCRQSFTDFEWIVVDDGSQDNTRAVVMRFVNEAQFDIYYIYQENGGKHRAVNRGVKEAHGELFFIVDSDDSLPAESLMLINQYWQQVKSDPVFGGVAGYMSSHSGKIHNVPATSEVRDCNALDIRYKHRIHGDLAEVFRTSVMREFPFPEIEGEKFVSEALVWNRIAQKYKLRYFPRVIYFRDYLDGGLTDNIIKIRMTSPIASCMHYSELNSYDIPFLQKVKSAINYYRFKCCTDKQDITEFKRLNIHLPWHWHWLAPLGRCMHVRDNTKITKHKHNTLN